VLRKTQLSWTDLTASFIRGINFFMSGSVIAVAYFTIWLLTQDNVKLRVKKRT